MDSKIQKKKKSVVDTTLFLPLVVGNMWWTDISVDIMARLGLFSSLKHTYTQLEIVKLKSKSPQGGLSVYQKKNESHWQ